jgi:predicted phosphoribosyltransferase
MKRYENRREAGLDLAQALQPFRARPDAIVLGLPRGGVPVAYEVARALDVPLDVYIVRKLGLPGHEEFAMGAIASGGTMVVNPDVERFVPRLVIDAVAEQERRELERRERLYRGERPPLDLAGRTAILVDDGLATGSTMRAAARAVRQQGAARVVIAVPVAAPDTCADMRGEADEVVCPYTPDPFRAVGLWYEDFDQTSDDEVRDLLAQAARRATAAPRIPG